MPAAKKTKKTKTPTKEHRAALAAALSPETPADLLVPLYENAVRHYDNTIYKWFDEKPDVMAALAQNPNTPPRLLARLADGYPQAFLSNPITPLLSLETPTFWSDLRPGVLLNLLNFEAVPPPVLHTVSLLPDAQKSGTALSEALRFHVGTAGELGPNEWQNAVREVCRSEAARMETRTTNALYDHLFADWVEIGLIPKAWCEEELLEAAPDEEPALDETRASYIEAVKKRAALPPDIPPDALNEMVRGKELRDSAITIAAALHPQTAPETLRHLGQRRENNLGLAVVMHPQTPPDALLYFAQGTYDDSTPRRVLAARHANADQIVLRELASDSAPLVRRLARRHQNAPDDLIPICRTAALTPGKIDITLKQDNPLWYVLYGMYQRPDLAWLQKQGNASEWLHRLGAAFALHRRACERAAPAKTGKSRKGAGEGEQAVWNRLQTDGNRLVRAVINAPATPVFNFTL